MNTWAEKTLGLATVRGIKASFKRYASQFYIEQVGENMN
jgi:hypothetical protein